MSMSPICWNLIRTHGRFSLPAGYPGQWQSFWQHPGWAWPDLSCSPSAITNLFIFINKDEPAKTVNRAWSNIILLLQALVLKHFSTASTIGMVRLPASVLGEERNTSRLPLCCTYPSEWIIVMVLFSKSKSSQRSPSASPIRHPVPKRNVNKGIHLFHV